MSITFKIHNVFHDKEDFPVSKAEDRMLAMCTDSRVENIRIASGESNSPVFIELDESVNSITAKDMKKISRMALREFSDWVGGIDVDRTVKDKNIRIE